MIKSLEFLVGSYGGRDISGEWLQYSIIVVYDSENDDEIWLKVYFAWHFHIKKIDIPESFVLLIFQQKR